MAGKKPVRKKVSKKASVKSPSLLAKYWQNYRSLIILAALAVIFIGYWIIAQELPKRAEKRDLIQKHQKLEEIANKISAQNAPDAKNSEKWCSYQNQKFDKGDLYCYVEQKLEFKTLSVIEANDLAYELSEYLDISLSLDFQNNKTKAEFTNNSGEHTLVGSLPDDLRECNIGFIYNSSIMNKSTLKVSLTCFQISQAEHFPLKK